MSMGYTKPATVDERIGLLPKQNKKPENKFNSKPRSKQLTPLTTEGFENYSVQKTVDERGMEKIKIGHAAGPIYNSTQTIHTSLYGSETPYDEDIVANWVPHMTLSVADDQTGQALSAAQIDSLQTAQKWIPHFFLNPMQELDYIVIEALMRFTFCGPLMDALTKFIVGTKFQPELELINPSNDQDKNRKQIAEGEEVITNLMQIDNQLNQSGDDNFIDTSFTEKISALISVADGFNRSALMFGYDKPIKVGNKSYKEIPSSLKFAHARDLGIIDVDPGTWRLRAVQWRNAFNMVPSKDMIYLWNPLISSKTRGSWLYGDSMLMPMIDAARVIRKNIGVNFPAMAEATWAGMFILTVKPQSQSIEEKRKEYQQIASTLVRGGPNILIEDPANIKTDTIDFQPKVNEFSALTEMLLKYCVAATGLPHSMFYDEAASNRATMLGKIQLATSVVINPMRSWIGRSIASQWYQRWFRLIYKDTDMYKKFKIKMAFSDLNIAEWYDKIAAVNQLDSRKQLTDDAYGSHLGIDNYQDDVEPDAITTPGGASKNTINFSRELSLNASTEKTEVELQKEKIKFESEKLDAKKKDIEVKEKLVNAVEKMVKHG